MTVTITTNPIYPIPKKHVSVAFTASEAGANYIKLICTSAPEGSYFREKLDNQAASGLVYVHEGSTTEQYRFQPDVGGAYTFDAQEISRGASTWGGGYDGDENSDATETILDTTSITVYVGSRMEGRIGVGSDVARVICMVFDDTIRQTTKDTHGETTPVIVATASSKAKSAAESASVRSSLAALQDLDATTAIGDLESTCETLIDQFDTHLSAVGIHANNDTDNVVDSSYHDPSSPSGLAMSLNELRRKMDNHMRNDSGAAGTGSGNYHQVAGQNRADLSTAILAPPASVENRISQITLLADLRRVLAAHKINEAIHDSADISLTVVLAKLPGLYANFLDALARKAPTTPVSANPGTTTLIHGAGFTES